MRSTICRTVFVLFLLPCAAQAHGADFNLHDSTITVSGSVAMSAGEVMKGMYSTGPNSGNEQSISWPRTVSHLWFGEPEARLNLAFRPGEKMNVQIGFEGNIFINTWPPYLRSGIGSNGGPAPLPQYMDWRLHQAQGIFSLLGKGTMCLDLSLGVMPYKYNPDVCNLGEFLFRSGTYPFFLINDFNFPLARLSGVRLHWSCGTEKLKLTFDQFVLSERTLPPFYDISLVSIFGVNWNNIIDAGAGVDFCRAIPVNGDLTTPDSARFVTGTGDTVRYTFRGTKVMARATFDPLGMVRKRESLLNDIVGENGGKIYGEIAIIGLKNYPVNPVFIGTGDTRDILNPWGYTKISERMPWMVGINIPIWKILDVCAFELERYPAPYPNDYFQAFMKLGLPVPTWYHRYRHDDRIMPGDTVLNDRSYDSATYSMDRWYWSLYLKKQIVKHFSLIGQIAKDHMRWDVNAGNVFNYDTEEITIKPGEWTWRFGMLFEF